MQLKIDKSELVVIKKGVGRVVKCGLSASSLIHACWRGGDDPYLPATDSSQLHV